MDWETLHQLPKRLCLWPRWTVCRRKSFLCFGKPFVIGKRYPFFFKMRSFWKVSSLIWKVISSLIACLTYDTLWAGVHTSWVRVAPMGTEAHILQCCCWYMLCPPSYREIEIPYLGSFSAGLFSLSSMGNWVTLTVAAVTSLHKRAAKLQNFKGRVTVMFILALWRWMSSPRKEHVGKLCAPIANTD